MKNHWNPIDHRSRDVFEDARKTEGILAIVKKEEESICKCEKVEVFL